MIPAVGKSGTSRIAVAEVEAHAAPLRGRAQVAQEEQVRELLRDACERLEVVERALAALGVPRPQAGCDELLDERRLPSGRGQERPQVACVDAEAGEPGARRGDVRLALAEEVLAGLDARDDDAELLELADEVGRRRKRGRRARRGRSRPRAP